jgi:hypothetical protein
MLLADATYNSGDVIEFEINGAVQTCPGPTGYDYMTVSGILDLGGAGIDVKLGYVPTNGTTYTIATAGTRTNAFNVSTTTSTYLGKTYTFEITYVANNVVLTVVNPLEWTACPSNVVQDQSGLADCDAVISWNEPVFVGGVPSTTGTRTLVPVYSVSQPFTNNGQNVFAEFWVGMNTVTYTVSDAYTTTSCVFTVTLNDLYPPVITCPTVAGFLQHQSGSVHLIAKFHCNCN